MRANYRSIQQCRILSWLTFIVSEDVEEGFKSLQEASLMAQVHKKLVSAIAHL